MRITVKKLDECLYGVYIEDQLVVEIIGCTRHLRIDVLDPVTERTEASVYVKLKGDCYASS